MFKKKKPVKKLSSKAVVIKSKNKPEKAKKVNKDALRNIIGIVAFIILGIAVVVALGFLISHFIRSSIPGADYETYSYNGFDFVSNGVLWQTTIYDSIKDTNYNIQLHNDPKSVEDVPVNGDVIGLLNRASGFYLTFDPAAAENATTNTSGYITLSAYEISSNYASVYQRPMMAACDREYSPDCDDREIIDCSDPNIPAIYLIAEGPAEVTADDHCIYVRGEGKELVRAANRLLYQWYGIMK